MKRKDYFKQMIKVYVMFTILGTASVISNEGMSQAWKVIIPTFFFGTQLAITLYGLIKYEK